MQANQRPVGVRNDPFANSVHIPGIGGGKTFFFPRRRFVSLALGLALNNLQVLNTK